MPQWLPRKLTDPKKGQTGNHILALLRRLRKAGILEKADAGSAAPGCGPAKGTFKVFRKSRHHVSSLFNSPMPYAMFFSGGQAVHYSPDFARTGYNGCSHGCVNIRARTTIAWIFDQVRVGDRVYVYWS